MKEVFLLGKLILTQLVKMIAFYDTQRFIIIFTRAHQFRARWIQSTNSQLNFFTSILILFSYVYLGLQVDIFPEGYLTQNLSFRISHASYMLCSSDPHIIWHLVNGKKYEPPHYTISSLLGSNIYFTPPSYSHMPLVYVVPSSSKVKGKVFHPIHKTGFLYFQFRF
jgi:hypothetical protein